MRPFLNWRALSRSPYEIWAASSPPLHQLAGDLKFAAHMSFCPNYRIENGEGAARRNGRRREIGDMSRSSTPGGVSGKSRPPIIADAALVGDLRKALQVWYLLGRPERETQGDIILFAVCVCGGGPFYARKFRWFVESLSGGWNLHLARIAVRHLHLVRIKTC